MSGEIWVRGIAAHAYHGVFEEERAAGQRFVLDLGFELETRAAARTDALEDSTSYAEVAAAALAVLTGKAANLIETVAERIAARVLEFPGITAVTVVLHKPEAPVGIPVSDVALTIRRTPLTVVPPMPVPVAIGLGGNVGDVVASLRAAAAGLGAALEELRIGPLVRTAAMTLPGSEPQDDYLNTVVTGMTRLAPLELLAHAQQLELAAGRVRDVRWGPRTLDIDLLRYGSLESAAPELVLPHPGATQRAFVVVPWAALEPGLTLLGGSENLGELAATLAAEIKESREGWV